MKYKLTREQREEKINEIIDTSEEPIFCVRCETMIDLDSDDYYVDRYFNFFCCYCCKKGLLEPDVMI